MQTKTCSKCLKDFPATQEFFYRHPSSKFGVTPRCKPCVNQDNTAGQQRRLVTDPEKVRAMNAARTLRHYHKNIDKSRTYQREQAALARQNPEKRARINMRKRGGGAGMTPDAFDALFDAQGRKCAICEVTEPSNKTGPTTWNLDHCHKTGQVRFILCCHCNRGLGAFRDNPEFMRRAAELLEKMKELNDDPLCSNNSTALSTTSVPRSHADDRTVP